MEMLDGNESDGGAAGEAVQTAPGSPSAVAEENLGILNIGVKAPLTSWNPEVVQMRWQVRWSAKGLQPVKPVLHLIGALTLRPGTACCCSCKPPSSSER